MNQVKQVQLPNSTGVLVLGILSIVFCCCYGAIGLVFGLVALYMSKAAYKEYYQNPGIYTEVSIKNLNAGRVCAIIGVILSSLMLTFIIVNIITDTLHLNWHEFHDFLMLD